MLQTRYFDSAFCIKIRLKGDLVDGYIKYRNVYYPGHFLCYNPRLPKAW